MSAPAPTLLVPPPVGRQWPALTQSDPRFASVEQECKAMGDFLADLETLPEFQGQTRFRLFQRWLSSLLQREGQNIPLGLKYAQWGNGTLGQTGLFSTRKNRAGPVNDFKTEFLLQLGSCKNITEVERLIGLYQQFAGSYVNLQRAACDQKSIPAAIQALAAAGVNNKSELCTLAGMFNNDWESCWQDRSQGLRRGQKYTLEQLAQIASNLYCKGGSLQDFINFVQKMRAFEQTALPITARGRYVLAPSATAPTAPPSWW